MILPIFSGYKIEILPTFVLHLISGYKIEILPTFVLHLIFTFCSHRLGLS